MVERELIRCMKDNYSTLDNFKHENGKFYDLPRYTCKPGDAKPMTKGKTMARLTTGGRKRHDRKPNKQKHDVNKADNQNCNDGSRMKGG